VDDRYKLGVWLQTDETFTISGVDLTRAEYDEHLKILELMSRCELSVHFRAIEQNKLALDGLVTALDSSQGRPPSQRQWSPDHRLVRSRFLVLLANVLSSVRAYFDATAHVLSKTYGKESAQFEGFDTDRRLAYDSQQEFRLFEQLRNVMQHSSDLPLVIQSSGKTTSSMRLVAKRDQLLRSAVSGKPKIRADVTAGPESIDVARALEVYWDAIREIERGRIKLAAAEALPGMRRMQESLLTAEFPNDSPTVLISLTPEGDMQPTQGLSLDALNRNIAVFEAGLINFIDRPANQTDTTSHNVTPEALTVMRIWNVEGSPAVAHHLNSIASDPHALSEAVIGLVNLAGITLHQLHMVLGRDVLTTLKLYERETPSGFESTMD
jgi:hypothetical protein